MFDARLRDHMYRRIIFSYQWCVKHGAGDARNALARNWPKKCEVGAAGSWSTLNRLSGQLSLGRSTRAIAELSVERTLDLLHLNSGRALGPLLHAVFDAITFGQGVEAFPHNG